MSRPAAVLGLSGTAYDMGAGLMGQELSLLDWESIAWPHRASSAEPRHAGDGFQRPLRFRFQPRLMPSVIAPR